MPVPSVATIEGPVTASAKVLTRSHGSSFTYSTSAVGSDIFSSSSTLTEDTLSMITTPWVTESFEIESLILSNESDLSSAFISWSDYMATVSSSSTPQPASTTTYGISSPFVDTDAQTTVTILCAVTSPSRSDILRPLPAPDAQMLPGTFSWWTLESFTSSGCLPNSNVICANYPRSPSTGLSGTDVYPSSLNSYISRKGSRATIATTAMSASDCKVGEKGHTTPMHYM